jgi:putative acetyltransferase
MEMHIRPGSADELPELITLQTLALKTLDIDYDSEQITALIESQATFRSQGRESIIVAEVEGKVVGFASLSGTTWQIYGLYVHPDWMRRGIGKQLLTSLEEIALQKGCRVLRVITSPTSACFYKSQGYEVQSLDDLQVSSKSCIPCESLKKQLLPADSILVWAYRHRLLLLLLLGLLLGINFYLSQEQKQQPRPKDRTETTVLLKVRTAP